METKGVEVMKAIKGLEENDEIMEIKKIEEMKKIRIKDDERDGGNEGN